jgi:hypothetical protein
MGDQARVDAHLDGLVHPQLAHLRVVPAGAHDGADGVAADGAGAVLVQPVERAVDGVVEMRRVVLLHLQKNTILASRRFVKGTNDDSTFPPSGRIVIRMNTKIFHRESNGTTG